MTSSPRRRGCDMSQRL